MMHTPGEWNRVIMDYKIGESTYDITVINADFGVQVSTGNNMFAGAPTDIAGLRGTAGARTSSGGARVGAMYYDAVPEPASVVTLLLGAVGVLLPRRRR